MPIPPLRDELTRLPRSGIRMVMDAAWKMGGELVRLEVGEPDFETPGHIVEAMNAAATAGRLRYTPNAGIAELREAISIKLGDHNQITANPDQVVVTAGATQGLHLALEGLVAPGDDVLIPNPSWPNYETMIAMVGARPVRYNLDAGDGYPIDIERLAATITDRSAAIIVNSPSNPLGVIHDREYLAAVCELARQYGMWVLSDECYDAIVFDNDTDNEADGGSALVSPAAIGYDDVTVTVHSFSKTYAMTGVRLGYVSGPAEVIGLLAKLQESMVACVNEPAQYAGIAALTGDQTVVDEMVTVYTTRRQVAMQTATAAGLGVVRPQGAFYLWVSDPRLHADSALEILHSQRVAVAPGNAFSPTATNSLRVSLASTITAIETGLKAIANHVTAQ